MRRTLATCSLLMAVLLLCTPAAGDQVADELRKQARALESEMAVLHTHVQSLAKEVANLERGGTKGPAAEKRRERIRDLKSDIEKLRGDIAKMAADVARLALEAEYLEAAAKESAASAPGTAATKAATGLWGPARKRAALPDRSKVYKKYGGAQLAAAAAGVVRTEALADLNPAHKALLLKGSKGADVLVVKGSFDNIGAVLKALRIPYTSKSARQLADPRVKLDGYKAVLWSCGEALPRRKMKDLAKRLRRYVYKGGYLYTTDWGVSTVLAHVFPGRIKTAGQRAHLPEMIVGIAATKASRKSPYMRGVLSERVPVRWWLEQAAFDMQPGPTFRGVQLLESAMLGNVFKRPPLVAAVFSAGKGRVLHTLGHTYQQAGNVAGAIAAQRLMLNFVLMARLEPGKRPCDGLGTKR